MIRLLMIMFDMLFELQSRQSVILAIHFDMQVDTI